MPRKVPVETFMIGKLSLKKIPAQHARTCRSTPSASCESLKTKKSGMVFASARIHQRMAHIFLRTNSYMKQQLEMGVKHFVAAPSKAKMEYKRSGKAYLSQKVISKVQNNPDPRLDCASNQHQHHSRTSIVVFHFISIVKRTNL